eukprot:TRINITY_DN32959_c0_g1_i1.p1 TRINITY_DN32959_c0_g1~~TRINITY_DN32959_c0_g1_i1.p1  ORF type:complete len:524 (+),score=110.36 TRINITY_DN32959_c0_g1_i1:127-1572(+)
MIAEETDEEYDIGVAATTDDTHLVILSHGAAEASAHCVRLSEAPKAADLQLLHPKLAEVNIHAIDHHGDCFYIAHNPDGCVNFKIMCVPESALGSTNPLEGASPFLPYDEKTCISDLTCMASHLVVEARQGGYLKVFTTPYESNKALTPISISGVRDDCPVTVETGAVHSHRQTYIRVLWSTLKDPRTFIDYFLESGEAVLAKGPDVPNYDPSQYETSSMHATAKDGTKIPISLLYKAGTDLTEAHRVHLYGYGSYGICINPEFSSRRLPYVSRDIVYAIAHIRGGGEMGYNWYLDGKLNRKMNTFTDFITCGQHLIDSGLAVAKHISTEGRSAGGMLMGGVLNLAPEMFSCALVGVPFVDVITAMNPAIPLASGEFKEWGNCHGVAEDYDYMMQYSPVDNVKNQRYPAIFAWAGLSDQRVNYSEGLKWSNKIRRDGQLTGPVVFKIDSSQGHFGTTGRYAHIKDLDAKVIAFAIHFNPVL